jgi:hypothetical protein
MIECGGMLLELKKKHVDHGDWEDYLDKHCHEIKPRTARLYMRAAKNADKLEKLAAENGNTVADLSGRGAMRLLAPQPTEEEKAEAQAERDAKKAEREAAKRAKADAAKAAARATDPAAILKDLEAADVLDNIKDQDKREELLVRQLRDLSPPRLVSVLDEAWEDEDRYRLQSLGKAITQRLAEPLTVKRRKLPGDQPQAGAPG